MKKANIAIDKEDREKLSSRTCEHLETVSVIPKFDSAKCEMKFRRALRDIPSKTYIRNEGAKLTMFVRPFNLLEFGVSVNRQGLEQCETTKKILRYLDKNKEEFLKFEHCTKN